MIRNLDEIREQCLIQPLLNRVPDKINVCCAPTNLGKTYSIYNQIIPTEKESGKTHFVITAPDTMIHTQSLEQYEDILAKKGIRLYTKEDLPRFIRSSGPCGILLSNAKMTQDETIEELEKLKERIGNDKFMLLVDEIHHAGTTQLNYVEPNTGYRPGKNSKAKFVFAKLLKRFSKDCKNIITYTATPLYEMGDIGDDLFGEPMSSYNILNKKSQWPKDEEFNLFNSRLGGHCLVDGWIENGTVKTMPIINKLLDDNKIGLNQHWKNIEYHVNNLKNNIINTEFEYLLDQIDSRTITHFIVGSEYEDPSQNSASQDETLKYLKLGLGKYPERYKNKYPILVVHSTGCRLHTINDGESKSIHKEAIMDVLINGDVEFLISVEMLKMGFNCPRITHMIQIRKRKQAQVVVNGVIQALSRGNRQHLGLRKINSINDLKKLSAKLPKNIRIILLDYVKYFNQHFAILPNEEIYQKGIEYYKTTYASEEPFNWGTCNIEHTCNDPFCTIA